MNEEQLIRQLNEAFKETRFESPSGPVYGGTPFDMDAALLAAAEPGEREEVDEGYAWPKEICPFGWRPYLNFVWTSAFPMASGASIDLVAASPDLILLCLTQEELPWTAFAAVESSKTLGDAIEDILATSGFPYGVEIFGSLPTNLTNQRPDLVPEASVRRGCERYMEKFGMWWEFRNDLLDQVVEPHPVKRAARALARLPEIIARSNAEDDLEGGDFDEAHKKELMELYFATCYKDTRCEACGEVVGVADTCSRPVDPDLPPVLFGSEDSNKADRPYCPECYVNKGGVHHAGCTLETCPSCREKLADHDRDDEGWPVCNDPEPAGPQPENDDEVRTWRITTFNRPRQ